LLGAPFGSFSRTRTMRSDCGYGKGLSKMPFTKLNMAVFAPMARAMVAIATAEKPGLFRSNRTAERRSGSRRAGRPSSCAGGVSGCRILRRSATDVREHTTPGPSTTKPPPVQPRERCQRAPLDAVQSSAASLRRRA